MIFDLDPGEGVGWTHDAGGGAADARLSRRTGPAVLPQDQRRQRPACGGAAQDARSTGTRSRIFRRRSSSIWRKPCRSASSPRAAAATAWARSSSTTCATASARPPSAHGRHARARAWASRCRWLGGTRASQERRPLDRGQCPHPARRRQCAVVRLRSQPNRLVRGHEGAALPAELTRLCGTMAMHPLDRAARPERRQRGT